MARRTSAVRFWIWGANRPRTSGIAGAGAPSPHPQSERVGRDLLVRRGRAQRTGNETRPAERLEHPHLARRDRGRGPHRPRPPSRCSLRAPGPERRSPCARRGRRPRPCSLRRLVARFSFTNVPFRERLVEMAHSEPTRSSSGVDAGDAFVPGTDTSTLSRRPMTIRPASGGSGITRCVSLATRTTRNGLPDRSAARRSPLRGAPRGASSDIAA